MSIIFNSAGIAETMNNGVSNVTGADSIITENYTNVVQHGIKIDMSVSEKTVSGTPPLTFNSNGTPLIDYTIYGNAVQSGTPKPANPIQPQECGERTRNLYNKQYMFAYIDPTGKITENPTNLLAYAEVEPNMTYTVSADLMATNGNRIAAFNAIPTTNLTGSNVISINQGTYQFTITTNSDTKYIAWHTNFSDNNRRSQFLLTSMLNTGSTALPYEPYGYKIPISVNGRIYNVYIGNSPLRKANDGSNAVDTINYGSQQLIRRVDSNETALSEPITETIEVPLIVTNDGINVIDVQTTLKPSNISITYKGR